MVGVPGRSKACHTCRHRRIRCGGELPTCLNCAKSRRVCTGYQRQHTFILSDSMVADGPTQSHSQALVGDEVGSGTVMVSRWRGDQNKLYIPSSRDKSLMSEVLAATITLPQNVSPRNVFRDRFFSLMIENDFPSGNSAYLTFGDRGDWLLHILDLPSLNPALENALLAVCTARLGRYAARPALVQESLRLYTRGVSQARRDLLDESMQKDDQSLAACLSLLWYEVMQCPSGTLDGYRAHYRGCLELLQMRGAQAHTSGLAHTTLQILRLHTVVMGNQQGTTFLASPDWRDIPWASRPDSKSPLDRLVDILLTMPEYLAQVQTLGNVADPRHVLQPAVQVLGEGKKMEQSLEQWFEDFQTALPGVMYHVELSKLDSVVDGHEQGKLFPVAYRFPAFIVGRTLVYYWVALMSVQAPSFFAYETLSRLVSTLESMGRGNLPCICDGVTAGGELCLQHFTMDLLPGFEHGNRWPRAAAYNICQSVEYFLQDTMRGFGPASVLPALAWVKQFWTHAPGCWDREMEWIDDMVRRIHASGHGIAGATLGRYSESRGEQSHKSAPAPTSWSPS